MKTLKLILLIGISVCVTACEDEKPKERYLRLPADIRPVKAQVVKLPDGKTIDFPYVANALFYYSVMLDPHFLIDKPITLGTEDDNSFSAKAIAAEETDEERLIRWGFRRVAGEFGVHQKAFQVGEEGRLQCLVHKAEIKLAANVIAFELIGSGGIHGGYPGVPVGGSLNFSRSELSVTLGSEDPLTGRPITIDAGKAYEDKLKGEVEYMGMVGLDFFFKTSLFKVVAGSFKDALKNLVESHMEQMDADSWTQVWQSKIVDDPIISNGDTHLAMRGGSRANVRVGDTFEVYNMHYKWMGEECNSQLDYAMPDPSFPVAEMRVIEVGKDVSKALVLSSSKDYRVTTGAIVKIKKLVK